MEMRPGGKARRYHFSKRARSSSRVFLRRFGSGNGRDRWTKWLGYRMPSDGRWFKPADRLTIRVARRDLSGWSAAQDNRLDEGERP